MANATSRGLTRLNLLILLVPLQFVLAEHVEGDALALSLPVGQALDQSLLIFRNVAFLTAALLKLADWHCLVRIDTFLRGNVEHVW